MKHKQDNQTLPECSCLTSTFSSVCSPGRTHTRWMVSKAPLLFAKGSAYSLLYSRRAVLIHLFNFTDKIPIRIIDFLYEVLSWNKR